MIHINNISGGQFVGLMSLVLMGLLGLFVFFSVNPNRKLPKVPRILPWTVAAQIRRTKAKTELADAESDLMQAKHTKLQKELVLSDLEDARYKNALEAGDNDG